MPTETVKTRDIRGLRRSRGSEGEIAELARRQHGVVARQQLLDLGLGEDAIERRLALGRLHRLLPGVYAVGHRLIPRHGWLMAAVLASGPEAVLSHHSAASLWGLRGYSERAVDVTLPRKSTSTKDVKRHHSPLPADERTTEEGIPVTTVPRTILDLAATEDAETIQNLLRESEFLELSDRLSLPDLIERYPGRRYHLPLPRFNDSLLAAGKRYEVDCHWPEVRQIVELDGWQGKGDPGGGEVTRPDVVPPGRAKSKPG